MAEFKNRYVLAEGWPDYDDYDFRVGMWRDPETSEFRQAIGLERPQELNHKDCPKYRLVLEKVEV